MANPTPASFDLLNYKDLVVKRRALESDRIEEIIVRPVANSLLGFDANGTPVATVATLSKQVTMPTASSDAGNAGEFAVDYEKFAVYIAGVGWRFATLFEI